MSRWKIAALSLRNWKRTTVVDITPDADAYWITIAGGNANGKTSILEAIEMLFGGKRAQLRDPVHHGADEAIVNAELIELDGGGTLTIETSIQPDGEREMKLLINGVPQTKSPQALLDKIISGRSLNILEFLTLEPPEQRKRLLSLIDRAGELAKLEVRRAQVYDKRTEVGRDLKKAEGERDRLPERAEVPQRIVVADLAAERAALVEKQRSGDAVGLAFDAARAATDKAKADHARHGQVIASIDHQISDLEIQIARLREQRSASQANLDTAHDHITECERVQVERKTALDAAAAAWAAVAPRGLEIDGELARADAHNKRVVEIEMMNRRRDDAETTATQTKAIYERQTEILNGIEDQKRKFLSTAKLPVAGLDFDGNGLLLNGAPFAQASSAERIRVAFGIAAAASPHLADIWVRDGALLDDDSLEALRAAAEESNHTVWLEIVRPIEGSIVIVDGKVRE